MFETIEELRLQLEEVQADRDKLLQQLGGTEAERDSLREAVASATETLGHSGYDAADLLDAVGSIERLLSGKDLDMEYEGVAGEIHELLTAALVDAVNSGMR